MLWFDGQENMTLKNILVDKSEVTSDILSQASEEEKEEFE